MADLKEFSYLVDLYYAKIFYHCIKFTKNNHDSSDITQNTFTKAFINIKNLKEIDSFGAWIFTICNNEIKLFYKNKHEIPSDDLNSLHSTLTGASKSNKYNVLYSSVNSLDEKYKNLIILKYFAEFSAKEIATLTNIDEKLIKSRLYDARQKLKNILSVSNIYNHNQERKREIMSIVKLMELGSQVIPCMSVWGQRELLKCAENNEKFSVEVLSELSKIEKGNEFTVECEGKLSYDEFVKILVGCEDDLIYRITGQEYRTWRTGKENKLLRDVANNIGIGGGYIEDMEFILAVPSIINTANWYKKYFGWHIPFDDKDLQAADDYGHTIIRVFDDCGNMSRSFKGFHLWKKTDCTNFSGKPGESASCFVFVTGLDELREKIKSTDWDKISDIYEPGWGVKQFTVEDLNGFVWHFSEWICG